MPPIAVLLGTNPCFLIRNSLAGLFVFGKKSAAMLYALPQGDGSIIRPFSVLYKLLFPPYPAFAVLRGAV